MFVCKSDEQHPFAAMDFKQKVVLFYIWGDLKKVSNERRAV